MSKNNGGPAFPFGQTSEESGQLVNGWGSEGMSLRDYFAGQAMVGLLSNPHGVALRAGENGARSCARQAYVAADAMLAEREKGGDQ